MKKPTSIILLLGCCSILTLLYTNCSKVEFSTAAESLNSKDSTTGSPNDPSTPDTPNGSEVETAIQDCARAAQNGSMKTLSSEIKFDDSRVETGNSSDICSLGPSDNLAIFDANGYDGKLAARYEQSRKLNLPANAVVCDISLSNDLSAFKYDDLIYLTYNNYVIAGSHKPSIVNNLEMDEVSLPSLGESLKLFKFDWSRLAGGAISKTSELYCLGSEEGLGACSMPQSEVQGQISLAWDPKVLIAVGLAVPAQSQEMKFIVTGDNDSEKDCYHQELKFTTTVKYYLK